MFQKQLTTQNARNRYLDKFILNRYANLPENYVLKYFLIQYYAKFI